MYVKIFLFITIYLLLLFKIMCHYKLSIQIEPTINIKYTFTLMIHFFFHVDLRRHTYFSINTWHFIHLLSHYFGSSFSISFNFQWMHSFTMRKTVTRTSKCFRTIRTLIRPGSSMLIYMKLG